MQALIPRDDADSHSAILEVRAGKFRRSRAPTYHPPTHPSCIPSGAGGKEASIFAAEIFQMYQKFAALQQWKFEVLEVDASDTGGYKVGPPGQ